MLKIYIILLKIGIIAFIADMPIIIKHCDEDSWSGPYWDDPKWEKISTVLLIIFLLTAIAPPVLYGVFWFFFVFWG